MPERQTAVAPEDSTHDTGTVVSGDVVLFFRHFGRPGATPVLILHGANYFDSADWVSVATNLAQEREVVVFDQRGFGESGWSTSKDYSSDAHIEDMLAVLNHLGWNRVVVLGHSRGGQHALLFASHHAERTAGLILADSSPGARPAPDPQSVNNTPRVFPTLEALQASMSRERSTPPGSAARARLESFVAPVDGGFILSKRDPDFANTIPLRPRQAERDYIGADLWRELASACAPIQILWGSRSDRFPSEALARLRRDFAQVHLVEIDSGHDMAAGAARALTATVLDFLSGRVDPAERNA